MQQERRRLGDRHVEEQPLPVRVHLGLEHLVEALIEAADVAGPFGVVEAVRVALDRGVDGPEALTFPPPVDNLRRRFGRDFLRVVRGRLRGFLT